MRLDILVPHYHEPFEVVEQLLDSIKLQGGIDFNNVKVIVSNDGADCVLKELNAKQYPFEVEQIASPHGGVAKTRNVALDASKADYVMFCDCDDMFLNMYGLHLIFAAMEERVDAINSVFIEEHKDENGNYSIMRREKDATFVHGKVYRREYLVKNNIRFKENLKLHEDGYFNCIALLLTGRKKTIETPFYIWKWRDGSLAQKGNDLFVLQTYDDVMRMRNAICKDVKQRGLSDDYNSFVRRTVIDSYYDFNKPMWLNEKNKELRSNAEKAFKRFYVKHRDSYLSSSIDEIAEMMMVCRTNAFMSGLRCEQETINQWLTHIMRDVEV